MLLDDPMSELDAGRRERLVDVLRRGGQSVIAATELGLVPGSDAHDVARVAIVEGSVLQSADDVAAAA
jgi:DNA replication and repair protein RecF